jgi:exodeoxyribonuclease VII small subunit
MPQDSYSFAQARVRLEEIVSQVRKKDVSLEKSLDLLEEGVRLANQCTELIDRADWEAAVTPDTGEAEAATEPAADDVSPSGPESADATDADEAAPAGEGASLGD